MPSKDIILLHHSAIPFDRPQTDEIIRSHLRNPKIRQPAAYHYLVERNPDGLIVQLHPEEYVGYHAGNWRYNPRSIGICLAGDFTKQLPTPGQIESVVKLIADIQARWGIPDANIKLHKEVRLEPTACPGIDLRQVYLDNRAQLLRTRVQRLQQAEKHAHGERLTRIQRILARLVSLIP